ncbi:RNA polymerase sigma factor [Lederbergia panacisoli]|uniref:RNA polymerase sigma factor n=1 Tax=Lederbergia panacisoli TaxID=1255251 RepID=UPI00214A8CE3|nr:RNA polymerase sigma factor [Lederbergia panacisoli]MCR2821643.1 RNA polymerase sigma factor [Lederbergia panacisoli]
MQKHSIEKWFEEYHEDIYHYLLYLLGNHTGEAEDLLQEVFIKVFKKIDSFKHDSSPKTWLISIARNTAFDYLRKRRFLFNKKSSDDMHNLISPYDNPEKDILEREDLKKLFSILSTLKPKYREVLFFKVHQELSTKETAVLMNCSENKVRVMLHRAKMEVRKKFDHEGSGFKWRNLNS